MKVNWETKLVRVNTMTSSDYDALAYVAKTAPPAQGSRWRREKTPSERNRIRRKWALRKVDRQIATATDKVVVYPYRLQPSLGVTEREQLLFEKYKLLYL